MPLPATVRTSLARFLAASHEADKALHDLFSAVQTMVADGGTTKTKLRPRRGKPAQRGQSQVGARVRTVH